MVESISGGGSHDGDTQTGTSPERQRFGLAGPGLARITTMTANLKSSSSEDALYAHIHRLLDEHVSVHLTTYYIDCTQRRVYEVCITRLIVSGIDCLPISRLLLVGSCRSLLMTPIL